MPQVNENKASGLAVPHVARPRLVATALVVSATAATASPPDATDGSASLSDPQAVAKSTPGYRHVASERPPGPPVSDPESDTHGRSTAFRKHQSSC